MSRIAFAWLTEEDRAGPGADLPGLALALERSGPWTELVLLSDLSPEATREGTARLADRLAIPVRLRPSVPGTSGDLDRCLRCARAAVLGSRRRHGPDASRAYYLGAGTGVHAAAWALLAATDHPAATLRWGAAGELQRAAEPLAGRPLEGGVDLQGLIGQLARDYLGRALIYTEGNKTAAARLLGLRSYQTFDYWVRKYGLEH